MDRYSAAVAIAELVTTDTEFEKEPRRVAVFEHPRQNRFVSATQGVNTSTGGLLTVGQAASALGVHKNTVRNWANRGILRAVRLPGSTHRRLDALAINKLVDSYEASQVQSYDDDQ